jgi:two-component system, sporulation sensor kinase E
MKKKPREELHSIDSDYVIHSVFEAVSCGILITNELGEIIHVNEAACEILGVARDQMYECRAVDPRWHAIREDGSHFPGRSHPSMVTLLTGKPVHNVVMGVYHPRSSARRWILVNSNPILCRKKGDLKQVVVTLVDVTERKSAEHELQYKDRLLEAVAEATNCLIKMENYSQAVNNALKILGIATDVDRVYVFENHPHPVTGERAASQRFEWCHETVPPQIDNPELQNFNYSSFEYDWFNQFSEGKPIAGLSKEFPEPERWHFERQGIRSLLVVPIFTDDQFWGMIGFDDCIDERIWTKNEKSILQMAAASIGEAYKRRNAVLRLEESKQRYRSLFEHHPDMVVSIGLDDKIESVNPAVAKVCGYEPDELINHSYTEFIYQEGEQTENFCLNKVIQGEFQYRQITLKHKTGTNVECGVTMVPIHVNEQAVGIYAMVCNITEKKRTEELLRKSDKLSVIGQLAAGVAHEIRNPLTSIKGFVQLLAMSNSDETNQRYYNIMLSEIDRINFIVSEFLVLAKPQIISFQQKDIIGLLESVIILLSPQAIMNNIQIVSAFESDNLYINCEENHLKQVFINILKNAMESMPGGGEIFVNVRSIEGDEIAIQFMDEGHGIPQDRLHKLGTPFYSTKEKGTGLGLVVSYKIIEEHRGQMNIYSLIDHGTTVELILPCK